MLWLLVCVSALCFAGALAHLYLYHRLYQQLLARGVVDSGYKPTWSEYVGAYGCMGFIAKLNREIPRQALSHSEQALIRNVSLTYYVCVPGLFLCTIALFILLYGS